MTSSGRSRPLLERALHAALRIAAGVSIFVVPAIPPGTAHPIVGAVGTSGNAAGTPPHLHLGVYGAGGALDPLPLLIDR